MTSALETLVNSPFISALFAALVGGFLTLLATWWTLSAGFKNQRKILEDEQHERQRGAGWALIAEMSDNLARLNTLSQLANAKSPAAHMIRNLELHRHTFDAQLPLLALSLHIDELRAVTAAYSGVGILFAILEGKWEHLPYPQTSSERDVGALDFAKSDFEKALRTVAKTLLTDEERKTAELE
jgi:hypothetical protein